MTRESRSPLISTSQDRHNTPTHDSRACARGSRRAEGVTRTRGPTRSLPFSHVFMKSTVCWCQVPCDPLAGSPPVARLGYCSTLLVHCLNVLMSSWMTRSIHFRQGSFSLMICFFTMASNARSGVNRPVLRTHRDTDSETWEDGDGDRQKIKTERGTRRIKRQKIIQDRYLRQWHH